MARGAGVLGKGCSRSRGDPPPPSGGGRGWGSRRTGAAGGGAAAEDQVDPGPQGGDRVVQRPRRERRGVRLLAARAAGPEELLVPAVAELARRGELGVGGGRRAVRCGVEIAGGDDRSTLAR